MLWDKQEYFQSLPCIFTKSRKGVWRSCEVRTIEDDQVEVHYTGFDEKHNEKISIESERFFINAPLDEFLEWEKHLCDLVLNEKTLRSAQDENIALKNQFKLVETQQDGLRSQNEMLNKQLDEEKKKQAIVKEETELKIMALQQQVTFYLNENEELNNKLKNTSSPKSSDNEANEFDRVIQKLSEALENLMKKEEQLTNVQEQMNIINGENNEYRNVHQTMKKDKDRLIKENKKLSDQIQKLQKMKNDKSSKENKELIEKLKKENGALQDRISLANMEAQNAQDSLSEKTKELEDFSEKFSKLEFQLKEESAQNEALKERFATLKEEWEKAKKELEETTKQCEDKLENSEKEKEELKSQIQDLESKLKELSKGQEVLIKELQGLEETHKILSIKFEELKESSETKIQDIEAESKIANKRLNDLVKQLRNQLKKETIRNQTLEADKKELKDSVKDLKSRVESLKNQPINTENIKRNPEGNSSDGPKPVTPIPTTSAASAEMDEFIMTINMKLTQQVEENFGLKQQIKYLEESIQEVTEELHNKKTSLRNLIRRIESGALTTMREKKGIKQKKLGKNRKLWEDLVNRMEIVVVETSLQNEILRNNKKKMGNEIQRLHRLTQQQNEFFASKKKPQASPMPEDDAP